MGRSFVPGDPGVATTAASLRQAAERAPGTPAAVALLAALDAHADGEAALPDAFSQLMTAISRNYFDQDWAAEHEFSVWARLTDDRRAWGYGSDEEMGPLRWLVDLTASWFDGSQLLPLREWLPRFEAWAEAQYALVRRVTPGALSSLPFPPVPER